MASKKNETSVIYQEAEGTMIVMKGKDWENRKLKLSITHERGKEAENRFKLIICSRGHVRRENGRTNKNSLYAKYNTEKIELNIGNRNDANWIKNST